MVIVERCELMSEGYHRAVVSKVENLGVVQCTDGGSNHRFRVYFEALDDNDSAGRPLTTFLMVNEWRRTRLLNDLGFDDVGSGFDLANLVGVRCGIAVEHTIEDGIVHANVACVLNRYEPAILEAV